MVLEDLARTVVGGAVTILVVDSAGRLIRRTQVFPKGRKRKVTKRRKKSKRKKRRKR